MSGITVPDPMGSKGRAVILADALITFAGLADVVLDAGDAAGLAIYCRRRGTDAGGVTEAAFWAAAAAHLDEIAREQTTRGRA